MCSTSSDEYLKMSCCTQLVEHMGKPCYEPHFATPGGVPNMNNIHNVLRLPNSSAQYWGGQSNWTIRTRHNVHTHTGNTRHPKPQLKSSSCSAIPSHNSGDVISSHNLRNATWLTPIPSHNSRDTFQAITQGRPANRFLRYHHNIVEHAHQHNI